MNQKQLPCMVFELPGICYNIPDNWEITSLLMIFVHIVKKNHLINDITNTLVKKRSNLQT